MIRLRLLGSVELKGSYGEELRSIIAQPKPMALLAYLAAATPVGYRRREELLSVFWPELDSARGRRALSQALHVLRSDLDEGAISSRGVEELGIDRTIVSSDVDDFRAAIDRSDWAVASDLYRGELLSGFLISGSPEFDQWLDKERARLKSQAIDAAWHLSSSATDAQTAHRWARRAIELDPYSEDGIRRLLNLLDKTGNRAEAIRAYDEFRERIARDLESEPSKETRALADSLKESPLPRTKPASRRDAPVAAPIAETELRPESHVEGTMPPPQRSRLPFLIGVPLLLVAIAAALVFAKQRSRSADP
ncbi:MAG TPA: BTAD domain-containing putative transcriptional regulator, partial [Gemmatimonadaceae bacterium]|nr:BTAD domain-containing putative transcriptional regulator [Gemmatimonadaceae bacterium]